MKTLLTLLLVVAAFWFGTQVTVTPRNSSAPAAAAPSSHVARGKVASKPKPVPAPVVAAKSAESIDLGF